MNHPKNLEQSFLAAVQGAHEVHGKYLPMKDIQSLMMLADEIGLSYDERSGFDYGNEILEDNYPSVDK